MSRDLLRATLYKLHVYSKAMNAAGRWPDSYPLVALRRLEQTLSTEACLTLKDLEAAVAIIKRADLQTGLTDEDQSFFEDCADKLRLLVERPSNTQAHEAAFSRMACS
jgi:hypothetical protein